MRGLSKNFSQNQGPCTASVANHPILASIAVGHRYHQQVDPRIGQLHLHSGGSGILYKMDRSEATHQHECRLNQKILLAKHYLPLWRSQTHYSQQCEVFR
jgi:hypothetical protein